MKGWDEDCEDTDERKKKKTNGQRFKKKNESEELG